MIPPLGEPFLWLSGACGLGVALNYSHFIVRYLQVSKLTKTCNENGWVALTYDDGPGRSLTPRLLQLLAKYNAKGTFFLLGRRAMENPATVAMLVERDQEIGCHSMRHYNAWKTWPWVGVQDMRDGFRYLSPWIGTEHLYRPPHGKMTLASWLAARSAGYKVGWWTIDSGDTHRVLPDLKSITDKLLESQGGVILLHDFDRERGDRAEFVLEITERVLTVAEREGLTVMKLGDILRNLQSK